MRANRSLELLLVNPGSRVQVYQSLGRSLAAIEPPVWAGLIASFVRKRGISVSILDANALDLDPEETAEAVVAQAPRLVAVIVYGHNPSASTQVMPSTGALCKAIKAISPDQKILLVGGHVAALPERTLREEEVDFVCGGEGPYTIVELLDALSAGSESKLESVRGLMYLRGERVLSPPPTPLIRDLDREMSGMAWDLLPMEKYRAHNWHCFGQPSRQPYAALYTSLGCPFHCTFCCIQAPFRGAENAGTGPNSYRMWSPTTVIREIDTLVERYGVRNIKLADELFVLHPGHVEGLCDLIIERGYDLNIWAYARVDTLRKGMLEKLRKAGITWLALGIESANPRVRNNARKGYHAELLHASVADIQAAGIHVIGNFIFGLPEDDMDTMKQTFELALELKCEFVNFNCAMAYPGSDLFKTALSKGWPLPPDWAGYSQYSSNTYPLPTQHLSGPEVLRFRDHAFQAYFTDPAYQEMVLRKFGPETLSQIREMVGHKIERKFA